MPEIPDVVQGNPVESAWGNDIRDRTVQRYADAAARDSLTPLPVAGDLAYLDDTGSVQVYDGTAWVTLADVDDLDAYLPLATGGVITGDVVVEQGYWLENRGSIIRQGGNTDKVPGGTRILTLNIPRHSTKLARWVIQVDATFGFETTPVEGRLDPVPGTDVVVSWEQSRQLVWCQAAVWAKWTHQLEVEVSPGTGDGQVFFDSTMAGSQSAYWRASCIAQLSFWND